MILLAFSELFTTYKKNGVTTTQRRSLHAGRFTCGISGKNSGGIVGFTGPFSHLILAVCVRGDVLRHMDFFWGSRKCLSLFLLNTAIAGVWVTLIGSALRRSRRPKVTISWWTNALAGGLVSAMFFLLMFVFISLDWCVASTSGGDVPFSG